MKIAIVGVGRISQAHLSGIHRYTQANPARPLTVSAVVDTYPDRAAEWVARQFAGIHSSQRPAVLKNYQQLLEDKYKPDAVSVLLPHHLHLDAAKAFLPAKIAVQMQKPIGLGIRDGREMIELARSTGTPLVVSEPSILGRQTRLHIEWLKAGKQIGTPTFMIDQAVIDLKGGFFMTPWRHLKGLAGGGWFIDHGVHRAHWMLDVFGSCESVFAQTRRLEDVREDNRWGKVPVDTEDLASAILTFKSGVICQFSVVAGGRGLKHSHVQVFATKGSYQNGKCMLSGDLEVRDLDLDAALVPQSVLEDSFAHSYQELTLRMEKPAAPIIGEPSRALEAEGIIYACLESAQTGRPVRVEDVLNGKAHAYEDTVWEARAAAAKLDLNKLT